MNVIMKIKTIGFAFPTKMIKDNIDIFTSALRQEFDKSLELGTCECNSSF